MKHDIAKVLRAAEFVTVVGFIFHQAVNLTYRPEGLFVPRLLRPVLSPKIWVTMTRP